ncbi:MAG TPA: OmpA family protein [Methylomirabilota bacterium]|jgi:outer membrane protein OmpA-like peptidoglycan-associated protein|nr:OmpA family protein [Methylomirabilota bacterium]
MKVLASRVVLPALLMLVAGCAATTPDRAVSSGSAPDREIDQRVAQVEGRVEEMSQRLETVGGQVRSLESGVARAQDTADVAGQKAAGVDSRLTRLWANRFNQKAASSLEVFFGPDSSDLNDVAQTALAGVARDMEENPSLTVELGGYTDRHGALDYNYGLSQRRVNAVRRFLMDKGIQLGRIQSASLGPATEAISDAKKRRVTIRLMVDPE